MFFAFVPIYPDPVPKEERKYNYMRIDMPVSPLHSQIIVLLSL